MGGALLTSEDRDESHSCCPGGNQNLAKHEGPSLIMHGDRILLGHISPWFHLQAVLDHLWCAGAATRVLTVTRKAQRAGQCESWCAQERVISPRGLRWTDEMMASRHPPKGYTPLHS